MDYRNLGTSDVRVSSLCLGTQTWGEQNSEIEAHDQLDMAIDHGINFIDTAEMYPFPAKEETSGKTESIIGNWLKKKKCREKIILATKVTGRHNLPWLGKDGNRLTRSRIESAIYGSLRRLKTDYIDLYQLHWPDRYTNIFGRLGYNPEPDPNFISIESQLEVLNDLVDAGKVRYIGVSNETPWGVMSFLRISEIQGWPRMMVIQNPYSLLNRTFEVGLAEIVEREKCGLMAYSPLAFGLLTGKYSQNHTPENMRITKYSNASKRYTKPRGFRAAAVYLDLAQKYDLLPSQMALAFNLSRPFVTSTIIGATNLEQLANNIASVEIKLSNDLLREIEDAHDNDPYPCP